MLLLDGIFWIPCIAISFYTMKQHSDSFFCQLNSFLNQIKIFFLLLIHMQNVWLANTHHFQRLLQLDRRNNPVDALGLLFAHHPDVLRIHLRQMAMLVEPLCNQMKQLLAQNAHHADTPTILKNVHRLKFVNMLDIAKWQTRQYFYLRNWQK